MRQRNSKVKGLSNKSFATMKNLKNLWLVLPVAMMICMYSCTDSYEFIPDPISGDINAFNQEVQTYSKTQLINNQDGSVIFTDDGNIITIPANTFVLDGNPVEGDVEFEYIELMDKGLMMLYGVSTTTTSDFLESEAVFYFDASQNGNKLSLNPNLGIRVNIPSDSVSNETRFFFGEENEDELFVWEEAEPQGDLWNQVRISEWTIQGQDGFGYEFQTTELDWINCDIYYNIPDDQKTDVCVQMPDLVYGNVNTQVYMVINDRNSFVMLQGDPNTKQFCEPYGLTPIGSDVTFISISRLNDGSTHFGMKNAIITEGYLTGLSPEEKSLEEILDILGMF